MAEYRFIGTEALLRLDGKTVSLKRLGQSVELTDEQYQLLKPRVPLVSPDTFSAIGLPDDMIVRFPTPMVQSRAPKEFVDKLAKARMDAVYVEPAPEPPPPAEVAQSTEAEVNTSA